MKKYISIFILVIFIGMVSAAIPSLGVFKKGASIELKQTCTINGTFCNACNISSVDYPNGTRTIADVIMTKRQGDFNYTISGDYITAIGAYKVNGYCKYGSDVIKNFVYYFDVTTTGQQVSLSNIIIVIVFLILSIVCIILGYSFSAEHWLLKTFFYFASVVMGIIAINSGRIIASDSEGLSTMGTMGLLVFIVIFAIFLIYMFIYAFIEIIKALKEKKGVRWNYED